MLGCMDARSAWTPVPLSESTTRGELSDPAADSVFAASGGCGRCIILEMLLVSEFMVTNSADRWTLSPREKGGFFQRDGQRSR